MDHRHRAGKLKQTNKGHKQAVRSKRVIKRFVTSKSTQQAQGRLRAGSGATGASTASSAGSGTSKNRMVRREQVCDFFGGKMGISHDIRCFFCNKGFLMDKRETIH
jgi:hypothetical protein